MCFSSSGGSSATTLTTPINPNSGMSQFAAKPSTNQAAAPATPVANSTPNDTSATTDILQPLLAPQNIPILGLPTSSLAPDTTAAGNKRPRAQTAITTPTVNPAGSTGKTGPGSLLNLAMFQTLGQ